MTFFTATIGGVEYELKGSSTPSCLAPNRSTIKNNVKHHDFFAKLNSGGMTLTKFKLNYHDATICDGQHATTTAILKASGVTFKIKTAFAARTTAKAVKAAAAAGSGAAGGAAGGGPVR